MTHPGRLGAFFIAFALIFAAAPVSAGQVQQFEPDFYASELTGIEIEAAGPVYEITEAELQHYLTGEGEVVRLGSDSAVASLEISFFDDGDSPQESVDIYIQSMVNAADELEVVDRGVEGDIYFAAAVLEYDGVDLLYYVQVEEDVQGNADLLQAILASPITLEMDLEDAQAEVTIDGLPFMDNVVPSDLVDVVSGSGSLSEGTEATPVEAFETVTLTDSSVEVGIGADLSFAGAPEDVTGVEAVRIEGPNILSMVAVGETGATAEIVLNSFSSGIETTFVETEILDEEIDDDYAWRLLSLTNEFDEVTFMLVVVDTALIPGYELMHAHEVPSDGVATSLAIVQDQITVNGQPLMPEIDPEEMAEIAGEEDSTGESTQIRETPEATEEADNGRSGDPREDARLPEIDDENDEGGNTSETGGDIDATAEPTAEPGSGDTGLPGELTDSSWEGGVHGNLIEWDAAVWFVDTDYEGDLVSDPNGEEDTIVLQQQLSGEASLLYISVYGAENSTPQDYLELWTSEEYLDAFRKTGAEVEVLETRTRGGNSAVMLRLATPGGGEYITVQQAVALESGEILIVTLDVPAADMVDTYGSGQDVTINGDPVLSVFTSSQIQRVVGD